MRDCVVEEFCLVLEGRIIERKAVFEGLGVCVSDGKDSCTPQSFSRCDLPNDVW